MAKSMRRGRRSRRMRGGQGQWQLAVLNPSPVKLTPVWGPAIGDPRISHVGIEPGASWKVGGTRRRRRRGGQNASSMGNSLGNLWSGFTTGASDLWNKTKRAASSTMNTTPTPAMGGRRRRKMRGGDEPYCYTHDCDT